MKNYKKLLALLLALTMLASLFVGCGKQEEPAEEPHDNSAEAEAETEAETEAAPVEKATAHHVNAHGLESYSIHYTANEDGTYAYDYMNEAGELVSVSQEDVDALLDTVIGSCGDYTLSNRELLFCYQEQYYQFYQTYGMYLMFMMDTSKALDEQTSMDGANTWQHMFVQAGADMFHRMAATVAAAEEAGFDTTEALETVAAAREEMEKTAAEVGYTDMNLFLRDYSKLSQYVTNVASQVGYETVDDFLVDWGYEDLGDAMKDLKESGQLDSMPDSIGPGATLESYFVFAELQAIFNAYTTYLQEQQEVTDEDVEQYFNDNEEEMTSTYSLTKLDKNVVDVRHILVKPEETTAEDGTTSISDEAWAAAEAKANSIYEEWKSGEATEDSFATLAKQHTEDPGSAETGGLYEDVYPGQMVTEFNDWCFADGRAVGDHGVVKTTYGYHIMFFSGEGDYIHWRKEARDIMISEAVNDQLTAFQEAYPMERDLSKAILLDATAPTIPTVEEEEEGIETERDFPTEEEHVQTEDDGHEN